ACADSDGDGINDLVDIDDDNDGIRDSEEAPECFFKMSDFESGDRNTFLTVSTGLTMSATYNNTEELLDDDNGTGAASYAVQFNNSQPATDALVYQFDFTTPIELSSIYIQYINGNSHFINGANIKLQASNDGNSWTDLNTGATYNQVNMNTMVLDIGTIRNHQFTVTKNAGGYKSYRLFGVSGTIWSGGYSNEVYFEFNNFRPEDYPKTSCNADTDGDGIYNHLDLDSDGDGCSDLAESGAGAVTDSLVSQSGSYNGVGTNGLADHLETSMDSDSINYTLQPYVYNASLNACLDTDGDGIGDLVDIDDDNDGILDVEECPNVEVSLTNGSLTGPYIGTACAFRNQIPSGWANSVITPETFNLPLNACMGSWVASPDGGSWMVAGGGDFGDGGEAFSQTVNGLIANEQYEISFYQTVGADNRTIDLPEAGGYWTVTFGSEVKNSILVPTQSTAVPWVMDTLTFTATSSSQLLQFQGRRDASLTSGVSYMGIDGIKISQVVDCDYDGDGILNHLDTDSDNDGCSDAFEAGTTTNDTADFQFANTGTGANGFENTLETVEDGIYTGTYTYADAIDSLVNNCPQPCSDPDKYAYNCDFDGDGINNGLDLDDDNDGVLDVDETVICDASANPITSLEIPNGTGTIDGNYVPFPAFPSTKGFKRTTSGTYAGWTVISGEVDLMATDNIYGWQTTGGIMIDGGSSDGKMQAIITTVIGQVYDFIVYHALHTGSASTQTGIINISDGATILSSKNVISTIPVSSSNWHEEVITFTATSTTTSITLEQTSNNSGYGSVFSGMGFRESCIDIVDSDNDNIDNSFDLDSDNDGCSDAFEAGVLATAIPDTVAGPYGANGFADALETSVESGVYTGTYTYALAIDSISACINPEIIAIADILAISEDMMATIPILANDTIRDSEIDTASIQIYTMPTSGGTATVNPDGTIAYTPPANFSGVDTFEYIVCDTTSAPNTICDTAMVVLTVTPDYNDDGIRLLCVDPITDKVTIKNFGTNTIDLSNYRLCSKFSYTHNGLATDMTVLGGLLNLAPGDSVVLNGFSIDDTAADLGLYAPSGPFSDTLAMLDFTQWGSSGNGRESVAVAKGIWSTDDYMMDGPEYCYFGNGTTENGLPFWDGNDPPLAINDINTTQKDVPVVGNVLTNDNDPEDGELTVTTTPINPINGMVTIDSLGNYTYTPDPGFTGEGNFMYEVCDDGMPMLCDTAMVVIEVIDNTDPDNNPPIGVNDNFLTENDNPLTGDLLSNDSDPDGDNLTITTSPIDSTDNGELTIHPDGTFTYTPDSGFVGEEVFMYEVCDDGTPMECDTVMVTIEVMAGDGENDIYATDDTSIGKEGEDQTGNVVDNDNDPEGDNTTVTVLDSTNNGTLVVNTDGSYTYTPDPNFTGNDAFVYMVCDDGSPMACDSATVYITVLETQQPPLVIPNPMTIPQDSTGEVCMPILDLNEGDTFTATLCTGSPSNGTGILTVTGNELCIEYTPTTGYSGTDEICVIVCDQTGLCDTTMIPVTVVAPLLPVVTREPPVVIITPITVPQDDSTEVCTVILDPNVGDTFTATLCTGSPVNGVATSMVMDNELCIKYKPDMGYSGNDEVCIIVCDQTGLCDTVMIPVTVIPELQPVDSMQPPVVVMPPVVVPEDSTIMVCGPIVDANPDDTHMVTVCGGPEHGTATSVVDNSNNTLCITYTPEENYAGTDSICVIVCDQTGLCDSAVITIVVTETFDNSSPIAINDTIVAEQEIGIIIPVQVNDIDPDGDKLITSLIDTSTAGGGVVVMNGDSLNYTPPFGFSGIDTIVYQVCDTGSPVLCDTAMVIITVNSAFICVNIDAKVFLEGALIDRQGNLTYDVDMRTDLNDLRLLPGQSFSDGFFGDVNYIESGHPFNVQPWHYNGDEGDLFDSERDVNNGDADYPVSVVDWVLVSVRNSITDEAVSEMCQRAALLHSDGHISFVDDTCCLIDKRESYYVVVEHRNHLMVMSDTLLSVVDSTMTYDFTAQESFRFIDPNFGTVVGRGQKEVASGVWAMFAGNGEQKLNQNDTDLNVDDEVIWVDDNGNIASYKVSDFNLNGDINFNDRIVWEINNGKFSSVPRSKNQ
ncbi:MAG: Ig-like domain-containing protein, partial [Saprospiraceae bacterium]